MKNYTVSLTVSVTGCKDEQEALAQFEEVLSDKRYDHDSIAIEEESDEDEAHYCPIGDHIVHGNGNVELLPDNTTPCHDCLYKQKGEELCGEDNKPHFYNNGKSNTCLKCLKVKA